MIRNVRWIGLLIALVIGLLAGGLWLSAAGLRAAAAPGQAPAASGYVLLAWNDLGMHCYNSDFKDLAVLPPYNTMWAQVLKVGDPPQVITAGIKVTYVFTNNTYSVGKTDFWTYAQKIFSLPKPLPDNIGLKGKGLSGSMDPAGDHFVAEGIPLTEFSDTATRTANAYQTATIVVRDAASNALLTQAVVVAPVSSELHCDNCHSDGGDATVTSGITPTGKIETNILSAHDKLSSGKYPAGHTGPLIAASRRPVLCAECHSSNALGAPGVTGVSSLSNAIHNRHKNLPDITPDTQGCYNCHPGKNTRCLRDVMSTRFQMTCVNCHGTMANVALNPNPWLNEPRCDACHGENIHQNNALYRHSTAHGGLYCEGCHDSTHAIATSREPVDAIKFIALQGHAGTLEECTVCHITQPNGDFSHTSGGPLKFFKVYIPLGIK